MENMTVSDLAMAAAATGDSAGGVHDGAARTISLFIVTVLMVGVALFVVFTFCGLPLLGFVSTEIAAGSIAAAWMSSIGLVAAGSLFALLQAIAAGGVPVIVVLLGIIAVVAAAVGAFEAIVWVVHAVDFSGLWHSVLQVWHSATDWVVHAVDFSGLWHSVLQVWHSATDWVVHAFDWHLPHQVWHSATDWVLHLWHSIPAHHKWKILYT